jgi:hypothetical protein
MLFLRRAGGALLLLSMLGAGCGRLGFAPVPGGEGNPHPSGDGDGDGDGDGNGSDASSDNPDTVDAGGCVDCGQGGTIVDAGGSNGGIQTDDAGTSASLGSDGGTYDGGGWSWGGGGGWGGGGWGGGGWGGGR